MSVEQALHCLAVDVCDEIARPQPGVEGRRALVHLHDQVVNRVEVGVAEVDADGADGEAESTRASPYDDGCVE